MSDLIIHRNTWTAAITIIKCKIMYTFSKKKNIINNKKKLIWVNKFSCSIAHSVLQKQSVKITSTLFWRRKKSFKYIICIKITSLFRQSTTLVNTPSQTVTATRVLAVHLYFYTLSQWVFSVTTFLYPNNTYLTLSLYKYIIVL